MRISLPPAARKFGFSGQIPRRLESCDDQINLDGFAAAPYSPANRAALIRAGDDRLPDCRDYLRVEIPPMAQPKNTAKSTKQQPAGKGKPAAAPKKGK
ncbi:hypothetical protein [Lacipirellula parvula]|nr:hypothetical protein [Lacipirellula parvula]